MQRLALLAAAATALQRPPVVKRVEVEVTQVQTFGGFIRHAGTLRKGSLSKPSRPSGAQRLTRSTQRTLPRTDSSRWRRARTRYRKRSMQ